MSRVARGTICVCKVKGPLPLMTRSAHRYPEQTPSEFPKRTHGALPYPDSLREEHTTLMNITPRTIAYPILICCPDH